MWRNHIHRKLPTSQQMPHAGALPLYTGAKLHWQECGIRRRFGEVALQPTFWYIDTCALCVFSETQPSVGIMLGARGSEGTSGSLVIKCLAQVKTHLYFPP